MKVLVPVDGSELSKIVYPWAELLGDEIELMRSYLPIDQMRLGAGLPITVAEMVNNHEIEKSVNEYLEGEAEKLSRAEVTTVCAAGSAPDAILGRAEDSDMIVIASHGHGGVTRWLLGSVTTKVVRAGEKPVLVVSAQPEPEPREAKLDHILVPLDGSDTAELALDQAVALAKKHSAKLTLYEAVVYRSGTPEKDDWQVLSAREYLEKKKGEIDGVEVDTKVHESSEGREISEHAEKLGVDMIVMGSHGRSGVTRLMLGSVTEKVIQRAKCPVLIVYGSE